MYGAALLPSSQLTSITNNSSRGVEAMMEKMCKMLLKYIEEAKVFIRVRICLDTSKSGFLK
jgi:hypothetical protein